MACHVVLLEPEIPWNTGNIGRTCVAAGATLHLVGRLGFSLAEREIRRSGLDYWPRLDLRLHADLAAFERSLPPGARLSFFCPAGETTLWEADLGDPCWLVFGGESRGFPAGVLEGRRERVFSIPMRPGERSLNLSTAAAVAVYEALRRVRNISLTPGQQIGKPQTVDWGHGDGRT